MNTTSSSPFDLNETMAGKRKISFFHNAKFPRVTPTDSAQNRAERRKILDKKRRARSAITTAPGELSSSLAIAEPLAVQKQKKNRLSAQAHRESQKDLIRRLQDENAQLKIQNALLQAKLEQSSTQATTSTQSIDPTMNAMLSKEDLEFVHDHFDFIMNDVPEELETSQMSAGR